MLENENSLADTSEFRLKHLFPVTETSKFKFDTDKIKSDMEYLTNIDSCFAFWDMPEMNRTYYMFGDNFIESFEKACEELTGSDDLEKFMFEFEEEVDSWLSGRYSSNNTLSTAVILRDRLRTIKEIKEFSGGYEKLAETWIHDWECNNMDKVLLLRRILLRAFNNKDIQIEWERAYIDDKFKAEFTEKIKGLVSNYSGNYNVSSRIDDYLYNDAIANVYMIKIRYKDKCATIPCYIGHADDVNFNAVVVTLDNLVDVTDKRRIALSLSAMIDDIKKKSIYKDAFIKEDICSDENAGNLAEIMKSIQDKQCFTSRLYDWKQEIECQLNNESIISDGKRLWDGTTEDFSYMEGSLLETAQALIVMYIYIKQGIIEPRMLYGKRLYGGDIQLAIVEKAIKKELKIRLEQLIYGLYSDNSLSVYLMKILRDLEQRGLDRVSVKAKSLVNIEELFIGCIKNLLNNCDTEFVYTPTRWEVCKKINDYLKLPKEQYRLDVKFEYKGVEIEIQANTILIRERNEEVDMTEFEHSARQGDVWSIQDMLNNEFGFECYDCTELCSDVVKGAFMILGMIVRWDSIFGIGEADDEIDRLSKGFSEIINWLNKDSNGVVISIRTLKGNYEIKVDSNDILKTAGVDRKIVCDEIAKAAGGSSGAKELLNWYLKEEVSRAIF